MGRKAFINKIYSLCKSLDWTSVATPEEILREVYSRKGGHLSSYTIEMRNGCLFLDGDFILRVEAMPQRVIVSPEAEYYEGLCLNDAC